MRRLGIVAAGLALLAATALFLAGACGGGGPADLADREITDEELGRMVLAQSELGTQYSDFELNEDESGPETNEEAIENALDKGDEAQDIERFGIVKRYDTHYSSQEALRAGKGPVYIGTDVILHKGADGASANLEDGVKDAQRWNGMTSGGMTYGGVETFEAGDIGEDVVGVIQKASLKADQAEFALNVTIIGFQEGRLIGSVYIIGFEGEDVRAEATALARKLDERIQAVLNGEVPPTPTPTGQGELSLEEYFQQVAKNADETTKRAEEMLVRVRSSVGSDEERIRAYLDELVVLYENGWRAFAEIEPPAEVEAAHRKSADALRDIGTTLEAAVGEAKDIESPADLEAMFRSLFESPALIEAGNRADEACLELQRIADVNSIGVDLECGE